MKNLNEDLKTGKLKQAYLLYGEENYLKRQYKERITKALLGEDDTMNYAYYEGKGINLKEVIDLAETLPFFAERRLIVFENTGLFKSAGQIWQIISKIFRRQRVFSLSKQRWTSEANCSKP